MSFLNYLYINLIVDVKASNCTKNKKKRNFNQSNDGTLQYWKTLEPSLTS